MKKIVFVFVVMCLLCLGCRKDKDLRKPAGKVVDATTNAALPGANVALIEVDHSNWNTTYTLIAATTTNANGEFSFNNTLNKDLSYMLSAKKDKYFELYDYNMWVEIKNSFTIVPLKPMAYLKLKIKNVAPYDMYDLIEFSASPNNISFTGSSVDTTFLYCSVSGYCEWYGNQGNIIYYWIIKNNITTNKTATVFCVAHDTTLYQINY